MKTHIDPGYFATCIGLRNFVVERLERLSHLYFSVFFLAKSGQIGQIGQNGQNDQACLERGYQDY